MTAAPVAITLRSPTVAGAVPVEIVIRKPEPVRNVVAIAATRYVSDYTRNHRTPPAVKHPAVFCGHCANVMTIEPLGSNYFQACCPGCGTCGPRKNSSYGAAQAAHKLFE